MACKVKVSQTNVYSFLCLSIWYLFYFMAQSRKETINTKVSVNYLSRKIWCRLSAASPLRPAIFRTDSFLSSCMYLTRDPRCEETKKGCHNWTLASLAGYWCGWNLKSSSGDKLVGKPMAPWPAIILYEAITRKEETGEPGILTVGNIVQIGLGYELGLRLVLSWPCLDRTEMNLRQRKMNIRMLDRSGKCKVKHCRCECNLGRPFIPRPTDIYQQ